VLRETGEGVIVMGEGSSNHPWQKPLKAMERVWRAKASLQAVLLIWLCGFFVIFLDLTFGTFCYTGLLLIITFIAILISSYWAHLFYNSYQYYITDSEIVVESGVLFHRKTIIPLRRIQNVNVVQGPIMRIYGVKSILIETAGGVVYQQSAAGTNLAEGQLAAPEDADALADEIMRRVRQLRVGADM
jgi:membrane protein YdbS with pleckstrin-like domain